ncbi:MAG: hypothetical protein LBM01_00040 [Christensenellaceae bacterium]|jgi:plasmid maintenance system antidote protein VapI|nr:hypothetical protein [Christensenellaceae bacterium]
MTDFRRNRTNDFSNDLDWSSQKSDKPYELREREQRSRNTAMAVITGALALSVITTGTILGITANHAKNLQAKVDQLQSQQNAAQTQSITPQSVNTTPSGYTTNSVDGTTTDTTITDGTTVDDTTNNNYRRYRRPFRRYMRDYNRSISAPAPTTSTDSISGTSTAQTLPYRY